MEFRNLTPFPAQNFEGIDQHNQAFHVIVLRQTFSFASGKLTYADEQAPLCEVDEFFGKMNQSSVRQESDLCHYKPRCDVIANATAYAPSDRLTSFNVSLRVFRIGPPRPIPAPPQGLNHRMSAPKAEIDKWRRTVEQIKAEPPPELNLIDKTLTVCGERRFFKEGMILPSWALTSPKILKSLPLRYEYAFGGQCKIDATDTEAAKRLPAAHWMTAEQRAQHPETDNLPIAHTVHEPNIVGRGYAQTWHLDAAKCISVDAPQITYPNAPIDSNIFMQAAKGKLSEAPALSPAGFGIRAKVHPERRALLGTVDEKFIKSDAWLPSDFDFAIWNAAPLDQQTEHLRGSEGIELTNLCKADSPGAKRDAKGNTILRLVLPDVPCTLLMRMRNGTMFFHPMYIDTVIVEPEQQTLSVVWRVVFGKDPGIRAVDARLHRDFEAGFMQRIDDEMAKRPPIIDLANLPKRPTKPANEEQLNG